MYLGVFAVIGGVGVLLANPVSTQVSHFEHDVPTFVDQANRDLASFQHWLNRRGIHVQIQQQGQTALQTLQKNVLKRSGDIVSFSRDLLRQVVTIGFDLVLMLRAVDLPARLRQADRRARAADHAARRRHARGRLPAARPAGGVRLRPRAAAVQPDHGRERRARRCGSSASSGSSPTGQRYALFFGAFYGLMEFIPYIGPIIGPLPAVLVALFNDPISARLGGAPVRRAPAARGALRRAAGVPDLAADQPDPDHPLAADRLQLYGIAGALLALPVAAVIRQTVLYLRRHLVLEPWGDGAGTGSTCSGVGPARCPDCGAPRAPERRLLPLVRRLARAAGAHPH